MTVNINLSDVINTYYTVLYHTVAKYRIGILEKESIIGVQWFQKNQASFSTGTVGPQVGNLLSPLNTNFGFYLSLIPVPARGKYKKNEQPHVDRTLAAGRSVTSLLCETYVTISHLSVLKIFGSIFYLIRIENAVFSDEQEKESIYHVRKGYKNPLLSITVCHYSTSLVMSISDPWARCFFSTLILIMDSNISIICVLRCLAYLHLNG